MASSLLTKLFCYECWAVAWRRLPSSGTASYPCDGDRPEYTVIPCEDGHWEADPFLFQHDDRLYLFTENMPLHSNHGVISARLFDGEGFGKPENVLQAKTHLSYPQVFRFHDRIYMIPESLNSRTGALYECTSFPAAWKKKSTLIPDRAFVDTTVLIRDGKCILFLYDPDEPDHKEMKLYTAELDPDTGTLTGPVLVETYTDKVGRPAGEPFSENGRSVRPTQDCRKLYGGSIRYMAYDLTENGYSETESGTLSAGPVRSDLRYRPLGIHTVNRAGNIEVIDLFYRRFSLLKPFRAICKRLGK